LRSGDLLVEPPASRLTAMAIDAVLTAASYLAAYRLRFAEPEFARFLPFALRTLPLICAAQMTCLLIFQPYSYRQGRRWLPRLVAGVAAGTVLGVVLVWVVHGFEGISRISFAVDALLLALGAFGWRAAVGLVRLARAARETAGALEDRTGPATVSAGLLGVLRYRELLRNLVLRDLKLKYRGSIFGFLWSLANPLMMLGVYTLAFTYILQVRTEGFVFVLLLGLLNWNFFASSAMMSTGAVVDAAGLVKSVAFPRAILPVATVLFSLAQFLLAIGLFLPIALPAAGIAPSSAMLLFPVLLVCQIIFTTGVAFALATATSFFRDVRHLLEIALGALFWTTPILYQYSNLPDYLRLPVLLSPMSPFVIAHQQVIYEGRVPDPAVWLAVLTYAAAAFVLGTSAFVSCEDELAEQL
jgi:ABC-type polysaccharide/polyol phosphate export permease